MAKEILEGLLRVIESSYPPATTESLRRDLLWFRHVQTDIPSVLILLPSVVISYTELPDTGILETDIRGSGLGPDIDIGSKIV